MRALTIITGAGAAWLALSFIEVVTKNLDPEPIYHALNLFEIMGAII